MENSKNMPEKKFRAGGVTAAVWCNTTKANGVEREFRTVAVERRYKDSNGQWKSSNTFSAGDLPKLQLIAGKAFDYLVSGVDESIDVAEEQM